MGLEIFGKIFGHGLCHCGDEHLLATVGGFLDFTDQVVHLSLNGTDVNFGVDKAGGTDELLGNR